MNGPPINIIQACRDPAIWGPWFKDVRTWAAWFAFLKAMFGLPLNDAELGTFQKHTGRNAPSPAGYLDATLVIGRRGGKSLALALTASFLATFYDWSLYLTGGEKGHVIIVAADRRQSQAIFRYLREMLSIPLLAGLVERETAESIDLSNNITVEILSANFKTIRGRTIVAMLADELAFWATDEAFASPDVEIIAAARPAMASVPGAMLLKASSPYARKGELWEDYRLYYGKENATTLVWQAETKAMNPTVSEAFLAKEYEKDPARAAAEYGAQFRSDVESFVSPEAVSACVARGRFELPPQTGAVYTGFVDAAGGSGTDSMTMAIAHREGERVVVDVLREIRPPFSPESATQEYAQLLKSYRLTSVTADRWGSAWVTERFRVHGVECQQSAQAKSDLYKDLLPIINSGTVELLDNARSVGQICALERRVARGGRDSIDHPPNQHDDLANAIAGAVCGAAIAVGGAEGWLEYMRRASEQHLASLGTDRDDVMPPPNFGFSFSSGEAWLTLAVPDVIAREGSVLRVGGNDYGFRWFGTRATVDISRKHAAELLKNPAWRSLNEAKALELTGGEA
jgi:hypothetical protein